VTVLCGVLTYAFDASCFEVAVVFGVSVSLAVCALNNIPFVLGRFKFDFALLEVFDKEYVFVVRGRFQLHKNHGKRELSAIFFIFQMLVTVCPRFSIFVLISAESME
jgi:hypothetical protein